MIAADSCLWPFSKRCNDESWKLNATSCRDDSFVSSTQSRTARQSNSPTALPIKQASSSQLPSLQFPATCRHRRHVSSVMAGRDANSPPASHWPVKRPMPNVETNENHHSGCPLLRQYRPSCFDTWREPRQAVLHHMGARAHGLLF
jgi:hypothetical protein